MSQSQVTANATTLDPRSADDAAPLPPIYCPIPPAVHPCAERIDRTALEWARAHSFRPGSRVLDKLAAANVGGLVARSFPTGREEALEAIAKLHLWGFVFDDEVERMAGHDLAKVADTHYGLMRILDAPRSTAMDDQPHAAAFRHITEHFHRLARPAVWRRWIDRNRSFASGVIWSCAYRQAGEVPTPDNLTTMRMQDAGCSSYGTALIEVAGDFEVPAGLLHHEEVRTITDIAEVLLAWDNDIYSYSAEAEQQLNDISLVEALAVHHHLTPYQALHRAIRLRNRAMWRYLERRRNLSLPADPELLRYLTGLDQMISGHLDWGLGSTGRYDTSRPAPRLALQTTPASREQQLDLNRPVDLPTLRWWWTTHPRDSHPLQPLPPPSSRRPISRP
jgi:hypothetical protein